MEKKEDKLVKEVICKLDRKVMDRETFFGHLHSYPVFKTTRELTVTTHLNYPGCDDKLYTIPTRTLLYVNGYSAFADGYSMSPVKSRSIFTGKGAMSRFFNCPYEAMEFVEYREGWQ